MGKKDKSKPFTISGGTEAILESISDGVFTVDLEWKVTSFNRAAEVITGISRDEALGRPCSDVFRSSMCETGCALQETLRSGKPVINRSGYIINAQGTSIPISVSTAVLRDEHGRITGGAETFRDLTEVEGLRKELESRFSIGDLASRSPLMENIFQVMSAVADSPSTALVLGETGTGKELVARTIHALSPWAEGPFVAINCGALPDNLLESELFGYKTGAFTGALKDKPGRLSAARNGTIFLDEIGEVSQAMQVRLLRVIQERTFEPLGATGSEKLEARIIAATNRNLEELVEQNIFRRDLYYRINVVRLEIPPLRKRKEDIPLLVDSFIKRFNRIQKRNITGMDTQALSLLMAHDWPGNIRELENVIERSFIMCRSGLIGLEHLPPELTMSGQKTGQAQDMRSVRKQMEAQAILGAIQRHKGNRQSAARELGIHKSTLFRKVKDLGILLPEEDGRSKQKGELH
ncbi:sigma-54 interaction domain-containing protein [Desulfonatronovibrio hydrogenovorans]|uniref:sigma-54 interaction domain-containing protein n=1 Tax=Desulfonatronovibrio hydrogenovorans TaxID=53245 RepID=UPI00048DA72A|nr:sigma-54-dependent Fis family transcriptional regulator [Desulfonatronovibrio hydrogenovorans]